MQNWGKVSENIILNTKILIAVDDPLDCVGVHFGGGLTGLIAAPLFTHNGLVYGINEGSVQVSVAYVS